MTPTQLEAAMAELAKLLADQTGEKTYNIVRLDVNVSGKKEWSCYTPSAGWCVAGHFEAALEMAGSKEAVADRLRSRAAEMIAQADALSKP